MTVDQVLAEVAKVRELAGDYEGAHGREDLLRTRVLEAIAGGAPNAAELAAAALKTGEISFPRYCA